ncbi:MAG: FMN-binding protein [Halanaerobiales bacterium]
MSSFSRIKPVSKVILMVFIGLSTFFFLSACEGDEVEENNRSEIAEELTEPGSATYTGYSEATDNGYAWAKVTLQGDDITEVELMEVLSTGNEKDYDTYKYEPSVKAYQEMPERFIGADSADVDVYTGATHSCEKYIEAVARALDYAEGGLEGAYYDGTFQGESIKTEYGYAVALVTIKDDEISDVKLDEYGGEGEKKDFDIYEWDAAVEAHQEMPERFIEANSTEVDLYSNATQSSIRYKEAVGNALHHASKKPEEDLE